MKLMQVGTECYEWSDQTTKSFMGRNFVHVKGSANFTVDDTLNIKAKTINMVAETMNELYTLHNETTTTLTETYTTKTETATTGTTTYSSGI